MTTDKAFQVLIAELTKGRNYKKLVKEFEKWIEKKDRTTNNLKYFLVYDIDTKEYQKVSEYSILHNQIVLMTAVIPPKRDKDKLPIFDTPDYTKERTK